MKTDRKTKLVKTQFIVTLVEYLVDPADPTNAILLENQLTDIQESGCTVHVKQTSQEVICD